MARQPPGTHIADVAGAVECRVLRATERDNCEVGEGRKGEENDKSLFKGEHIGQVEANGMANGSTAKEGGGRGGGIQLMFSKLISSASNDSTWRNGRLPSPTQINSSVC